MQTNIMRYIQKQNKGANKYNEIYTKAKHIGASKYQWDIYKLQLWCKQIQWDIT